LQDIAEFFVLFQAMEKRFVAHASAVERLLGDHRTTFVVVSTLEAAPAHEAAFLARALGRREFHLGAIVANRVLPAEFTTKGAANSAKRLHTASGGELASRVAAEIDSPVDIVSSTLDAAASRFHDIALVATREAERLAELESLASLVLTAPTLDRDINDVADLLALGEHLRG
jgi:anion-transporting  ArsA/GET3 family ATPase